jgi:hypothetical protein
MHIVGPSVKGEHVLENAISSWKNLPTSPQLAGL